MCDVRFSPALSYPSPPLNDPNDFRRPSTALTYSSTQLPCPTQALHCLVPLNGPQTSVRTPGPTWCARKDNPGTEKWTDNYIYLKTRRQKDEPILDPLFGPLFGQLFGQPRIDDLKTHLGSAHQMLGPPLQTKCSEVVV